MDIKSARLIYFSPTQTTKKVVEGIAQGIETPGVEDIDLTLRDVTALKLPEMHDELAIIGSPVYAGRLPHDVTSRLRQIKGNNTPAVIVVVYGNRAYEDALLELRDLVLEAGCKPVAAGAFIGEHSFSTNSTPIAAGRPDQDDLRKARAFGKMVREKMRTIRAIDEIFRLQVPGHFPYKQGSALSGIWPVTQAAMCAKCENCASVCPTGAITVGESVETVGSMCIRCCACVKTCSTGARVMEEPRIKQVAEQLSENCNKRNEPEIYM
jgi:ferredoxin